jgi:hypothetical protein
VLWLLLLSQSLQQLLLLLAGLALQSDEAVCAVLVVLGCA